MAGDLLHQLLAGEAEIDLPVLLVAAHPDDEVIGFGGQMPRLRRLSLLHVTDGAPRNGRDAAHHGFPRSEDYASTRRAELHAALHVAGVAPLQVDCLDVPDQTATQELPRIIHSLVERLRELRPAAVITHPYEGGHPDHDATALAVQVACDWLHERGEPVPQRVEMTSYHAGSQNILIGRLRHAGARAAQLACRLLHAWGAPVPARINMAPYNVGPMGIEVGRFLHHEEIVPTILPLSPAMQARKQLMLDQFVTQRETLSLFPAGSAEMLRPAPCYDFTTPPHSGPLLYEIHSWGITGAHFRAQAAQALTQLRLKDVPAP